MMDYYVFLPDALGGSVSSFLMLQCATMMAIMIFRLGLLSFLSLFQLAESWESVKVKHVAFIIALNLNNKNVPHLAGSVS